MFVLILIPFGGNQSDVAACLADETIPLDHGLETILYSGEEVILTVFPLCVTGDMPQQNANSGVMSHKSTRGCRYCFQKTADRGLLSDDVFRIGRYQQPHNLLFAQLSQQAVNRSKKTSHDIFAQYGVTPTGHIFHTCFPLLDPFTSYPNDPMHAELRLAKYYHQVLIEDILSAAGLDAYAEAWNQLTLPHGWGLPQNPISHKGSMVFSEHGRIGQMNPLILLLMFGFGADRIRSSMDNGNGKSFFKRGIIDQISIEFGVPLQENTIIKCLIRVAFAVSQCFTLSINRVYHRRSQKHCRLSF